jgi:hypothetical protein
MNEDNRAGTCLIGEYLVLSSWLERYINRCLDHFQFDKPIFDSIEKESFDFKCKRLRNYLHILEAYGHFQEMDLTSYYELLGSLEVEFYPIRRLRNLLAHAIVSGEEIVSSRRSKGENSLGMRMSVEQLRLEKNKLESLVSRAEDFFEKLDAFLTLNTNKKGPVQDPFLNHANLDQ